MPTGGSKTPSHFLSMFDLQFFKPLFTFVIAIFFLGLEGYGLIRLVIRLAEIENFPVRIGCLLALIPLVPILIYANFVFFYMLGGGH